ncbi:MAG: NADP-dependent malic enzyme [Microgenomates group bacterium]
MNTTDPALLYHQTHAGKLGVVSLNGELTKETLPLAYTPGVANPSREIATNKDLAYDLTLKGRTIAVISDGSAVLGLGNIGPEAALPVMEGKSLLIKQFGGVDSFPLVIDTQDPDEIIAFVRHVAPTFAGINLEDIAAPNCFVIEDALQDLGIPVFHDDQHGTAIVVRAALLNAAKVVGKSYDSLKVVIIGAGAAGLSIAKMLLQSDKNPAENSQEKSMLRVLDLIMVDSKGAIYSGRNDQNEYKNYIAEISNSQKIQGSAEDAIKGADVVIGVSKPGAITVDMVKSMAPNPIVFALANPTPEIMPDQAALAGASVISTGRSDFPNQINNVLAFPGIFRAVVLSRLTVISEEMMIAASDAIAGLVTEPTATNIIPSVFYPGLAEVVATAVASKK